MRHKQFIRECYSLAISSGKKGNHTFGAVLVHDGEIIETAENTEVTGGGKYGHAEYNLAIKCMQRYPDSILSRSILYTSTAPCVRCIFAILAAGIPKIVYGVSNAAFSKLIPGDHKFIPCEEIIRRIDSSVEVIGPILEDEGLRVFEYWDGKYIPLEEILERAKKAKELDKGE